MNVFEINAVPYGSMFGSGGNDQIASGENSQFESSRNRQ